MSRRVLGTMLAIGALVVVIYTSFFQNTGGLDSFQKISYAVFLIGIFLIPEYSKKKSNDKE